MPGKAFWDSNLWIYLFTKSSDPVDTQKRQRLHLMLNQGWDIHVSAQVLNEVANVLLRKYNYSEALLEDIIQKMINATTVWPLSVRHTQEALVLKSRFKFSLFDSIIVASAIDAGCNVLHSEDFQDGLTIEQVVVENPFTQSR